MKKIISLSLIFVMLLSGCADSVPVVDTPDQPEPTREKVIHQQVESTKTIIDALDKLGYDSKDYSLTPTDEYFYPEYVHINNELQTVYLKIEDIESKTDYIYEDEAVYSTITNMATSSDSLAAGGFFGFGSSGSKSESSNVMSAPPMSYIDPGYYSTSEYKDVKEGSFENVKTSPLSTFAADVDTASYTNFRAVLRDKLLENTTYYNESLHDIRTEEMLNYFDYNFALEDYGIFDISAEISQTPWNAGTQLLVLNIKADELPKEKMTGSNLVFLIDTSGSMNYYEKLGLLKESLLLFAENLTENDTISIVTYSGNESVILEGVKGNDYKTISEAIDTLSAYGSTNGEGGIKKAYEIAEKYKDGHSNSRIIMCSDGDLNVGITSEDDLIELVEKNRDSGVYLSVLGFGLGNYKDNKMEALADNGNGNYHYIDTLNEGHKVLVDEITSTLVTIADDVKFQIEFNPNYIKSYRKIGYENREMANEDFNDDAKDGGEVGYGHEIIIVYELVPVGSTYETGTTNLKYQDNVANTELTDWMTLSIRYKPHGEKTSELIEYVIDENNYTDNPSDDWSFVTNVVAFSSIVNGSKYLSDIELENIIENLECMELDEEKMEFLALVRGYEYIDKGVNDLFD